jgi:hypothetical protein
MDTRCWVSIAQGASTTNHKEQGMIRRNNGLHIPEILQIHAIVR